MKKLLFVIALCCSATAFAQQDAWVYFTDKQDTEFYLENPLQMLTQRSLDRRAAQNIALDTKDVPVTQAYVDQVEAASGITVLAKSKWLNAVHVRGFQLSINALSNLNFVASVDFANDALDANSDRQLQSGRPPANLPVANSSARQLNIQADFNYGTSENQIQMLNGHLLHQQNHTGTGKIIAIMDAGFPGVDTAPPFQRLFDNNLVLGGYNFVDRDQNIYSRNSHGTLVLSTMGGYAEGQLVGTAPDSQYYLFITEAIEYENPLEESLWVEAAEMADSLGVDIITTSLGYPAYDNPAYNYSYEERNGTKAFISRGADIAFSRGMVVVVSGGNEGGSDDNHVSVPADAFDVLSIGAVNASEEYASFSSIGPTVDGRVKPDVVAQGVAAVIADETGEISFANGTSFSGPIIAGMVATFWSAVPGLTNRQVTDFVKQSSDLFSNPTPLKGYGVPDFNLALQNALAVDQYAEDIFTLWPNPVRDAIHLEASVSEPVQLYVYDQLGQVVLQGHLNAQTKTLDCSSLASGIYLYKLTTLTGAKTGKFIKI